VKNWKTNLVAAALFVLWGAQHAFPAYAPLIQDIINLLAGTGFVAAKDAGRKDAAGG
jgi:hypothetical protein